MGQKSGFWGVPGSETCKKYMGASILTIFQIFKKSIFKKFSISVFFNFLAIFRLILTLPSNAP